MKKILTMAGLLFLVLEIQADEIKETTRVHRGLMEQQSLYNRWSDEVFQSPGIRLYRWKYRLSSLSANYLQRKEDIPFRSQDGKQEDSWSISTSSFVPLSGRKFLWGDANYKRTFIEELNFSNTSDYDLLYPQVIADVYRHNSRMERYEFRGGYGMKMNGWSWGIQGHFRALHEYRKQDARSRNIVSDLDASAGAAYNIGTRYALFADFSFRKYKQNSSVKSFATTIKKEQLMMMGPATYYFRFSGEKPNALYNGRAYGASAGLASRDGKGFDLILHYRKFTFDRTVSELNLIPLTSMEEHTGKATAGWKDRFGNHSLGIRAEGLYVHKTGIENMLGSPNGNIYPIVARFDQYYSEEVRADGSLLYGYTPSRAFSAELAVYGGIRKWEEKVLLPEQIQRIDYMHFGGNLVLRANPWKRHLLVLDVDGNYIKHKDNELKLMTGKMVNTELKKDSPMGKIVYGNHKQQTTDHLYLTGRLTYSLALKDELSLFASASYSSRLFKDKVSNHIMSCHLGILF